MKVLRSVVYVFSTLLLAACSRPEPVAIQRPEQELFQSRTPAAIRKWLDTHRDVARVYFGTTRYGQDTALVTELLNRVNDQELALLYQQTNAEFGTMGDMAAQLGDAFTKLQESYPEFKPPKVVTMTSGFLGPDLVVSDSLIIIGIDWFAGPRAKYRPAGPAFPAYILKRYQKPYIVPAILLNLSNRYNATNRQDQTLLADMVYYGKGFVFTKAMLPETPDSLIIGYTDRQLTATYAAQDLVWAHVIDEQLLYQTNPNIKNRYLNERPFTSEIGPQCPGAIGRWLGWRIVGRYKDQHSEVSIKELMANANARQIFEQSGYKGQKEDE